MSMNFSYIYILFCREKSEREIAMCLEKRKKYYTIIDTFVFVLHFAFLVCVLRKKKVSTTNDPQEKYEEMKNFCFCCNKLTMNSTILREL